ncbi:hypothetical protein SNE40_010158 [Patella caerulea]|uniref:Angiotensin-converting enzyme n=1 Tax=Patella caerulea TaxID=87958 RepID=A0AAN8JPZ0_PATCE
MEPYAFEKSTKKHFENCCLYFQVNKSVEVAQIEKEWARRANARFDWEKLKDSYIVRQFKKITHIGIAAMKDESKLQRLNHVMSEMEEIYSGGKVCLSTGDCHALEPGLTRLLATSRDYDLLQEVWVKWREVTGKKMKNLYSEFVELINEAHRDGGYSDTAAAWKSKYESETFEQDIEDLFIQLGPLYKQLHAFVRRKLMSVYGKDKFPTSGHIPAHLFGNMWSQQWNSLLDLLQPYDKESVDVTPAMKEQNYTALKMFQVSDEFFQSLGMLKMPKAFWEHSMIEKPKGRQVQCHASAWNFYNKKDFRVKQCTDVTMSDLITVHHEMGHIEYYLMYKDKPIVFQNGANPGFHEAVGDVLALSVSTPKHLQKINLLKNVVDDKESDINFMLSMALDKIAFLPFGYLMDQWRWSVFSGETPPSQYNEKWWQLRCKYQGISPPVMRSEDDFDPGAKYHIPANTPYIRYFVSFIIQFQFHKALCKAANQTGPLHTCDIYRSKEAGKLLSDVLKLGSSKPWEYAMEKIVGSRKMDAAPVMEYFKPLIDWLVEQNSQDESIGWEDECPMPPTGHSTQLSARFCLIGILTFLTMVIF